MTPLIGLIIIGYFLFTALIAVGQIQSKKAFWFCLFPLGTFLYILGMFVRVCYEEYKKLN
jgi:hypothetical protein